VTVTFRGGIRARAAIFDFNGTITLDEHILCEIFQELLGPVGAPISTEEYFGVLAGLSDPALVERALELRGVSLGGELKACLIRRRVERYLERAEQRLPVRGGSRDLVLALADWLPMAVASGAFREEVEFVLGRAGLKRHFSAIVTIDDIVRGKPDPEGFETARQRLSLGVGPDGLHPAEVVVFEDSVPGVHAAKAAGMACIAVLGTAGAHQLREADLVVEELGPELIVERLRD
jgi:beta-phosphoglucomutase